MLNIFLTWQLIETNNANKLSMIAEATTQETLNQYNITIDVELPKEDVTGLHIMGKNVPLTDEVIPFLGSQEVASDEDQFIEVVLDEPFQISQDNFFVQLSTFLSTYVFEGDEYRYGHYDELERRIFLYQTFEDKIAYTLDDEPPLVLQLDDQQQIISYKQSYFEFEELEGREREILSSLKAIEVLLNDQLIGMNDTITNVEFGYYSFFSPQGNVQVFAPMWRVSVDDETFLVNAIEGAVQQLS